MACDDYRLDLLGQFGTCKCGFPKSDHQLQRSQTFSPAGKLAGKKAAFSLKESSPPEPSRGGAKPPAALEEERLSVASRAKSFAPQKFSAPSATSNRAAPPPAAACGASASKGASASAVEEGETISVASRAKSFAAQNFASPAKPAPRSSPKATFAEPAEAQKGTAREAKQPSLASAGEEEGSLSVSSRAKSFAGFKVPSPSNAPVRRAPKAASDSADDELSVTARAKSFAGLKLHSPSSLPPTTRPTSMSAQAALEEAAMSHPTVDRARPPKRRQTRTMLTSSVKSSLPPVSID
ncbi:hypothetical protein AB1Y20_007543 [Prymnesium parvum]|uniref:Proteophosphoglycan ppg4 n=1 Tax=Prymnesium parvum TaxID=97485 RepID=A0AB34IXA5_PRYPA